MDQNQKPIYTKGFRNALCPYYRNCLDHAVKNHWEYWACLNCKHKRNEKMVADILVSSASCDLVYPLSPAFYKKVRKSSL